MTNKVIKVIAIAAIALSADLATTAITGVPAVTVTASAHTPNDGTYTKTSSSVRVYCETGTPKGTFAVYLHHGKRYIDFHNIWICIQGKTRFGYCGNWYIIK